MTTATISPDFSITIPPAVREQLNLRPGQRMVFTIVGDRIHLVPLRPATDLRGLLRGMPTDVAREPDRL